MSRAVAFDANNVVEARRRTSAEQFSRAEDPDDPGLMVTRIVLADYFNQKRDRAILAGIPSASEVQAVTAYGSYRDLRARKGTVATEVSGRGTPVMTFNWPFLVPADSKRTPQDLLKQAVELTNTDEVRAWRSAAHRWRADAMLRGLSDVAAAKELELMINDYAKAAKRWRIVTRTKWAFALGGPWRVLQPLRCCRQRASWQPQQPLARSSPQRESQRTWKLERCSMRPGAVSPRTPARQRWLIGPASRQCHRRFAE